MAGNATEAQSRDEDTGGRSVTGVHRSVRGNNKSVKGGMEMQQAGTKV